MVYRFNERKVDAVRGDVVRILLINVDSRWNMAIRKLYNFYVKDHQVKMIDLGFKGYRHNKKVTINAEKYDKVFVSNIFEINKYRVNVINCDDVQYGGIGSRNPVLQLPCEVENTDPFYFDYEDTSYGFITRGCIRKCYFCKVPKFEGKLRKYNDIENIVKHKKFVSLDNNILAYDGCVDVFKWLYEHNIKCDFNQGLDFRLTTDNNLYWLSRLKYLKPEYIFAFDDIKYLPLLNKKIELIKKYISKDWKVKFYIYVHPEMELNTIYKRVEWCRDHKCLPYIMRDDACNDTKYKNFYTDYASYCNTPSFFKNVSFKDFLNKRYHYKAYHNQSRIDYSLSIYEKMIGGK